MVSRRSQAGLLGLLLLAACAPLPEPLSEEPLGAPAQLQAFYRQARAAGQAVQAIEPGRSQVTVRVYRGGPLQGLGHDHIVAATAIYGYALWPAPASQARADLYFALDSLQVDEPERFAEAGLRASPSRDDAAATRRNMLDKVLDAAHHPHVEVHASCADAACAELDAAIALHGVLRHFRIPVEIRTGSGGAMIASGRLRVRHGDFGLTPYSIFGGALRVEDGMDVAFELRGAAL